MKKPTLMRGGLMLGLVLLGGCTGFGHHAEKLSAENGLSIIHTPSDVQTSYLKTARTFARSCTETDVDFSKTRSSGSTLGLGIAGTSESVGHESSQGALSLGGRDPAVLITRELMFRACELTSNINADQRLALKIYAGTLDAVIRIAKYQKLVGTASRAAQVQLQDAALHKAKPDANNNLTSPAYKNRSQAHSSGNSDDDQFDWSFDWDYDDNDDNIDTKHP
jgi:hypothetical protein